MLDYAILHNPVSHIGGIAQQADLLIEIVYDAIQWVMNINELNLFRITSSVAIEWVILGGTLSNPEHEFAEEGEEGEEEHEHNKSKKAPLREGPNSKSHIFSLSIHFKDHLCLVWH